MQQFLNLFTDGKQFLLRIDSTARVETNIGSTTSRISGEAILQVRGDHPTKRGLSLTRFALAGASVEAKKGSTGTISVIGKTAGGILTKSDEAVTINVEITAEINYESLDRAYARDMNKGCYYLPVMEPAACRLSGRLVQNDRGIALADVRVEIVCAAGSFEEIQLLTIDLDVAPLHPLLPSQDSVAGINRANTTVLKDIGDSNTCDPSLQVNRRRLIIQPVGFRSSDADPNPSGSTAATQLDKAREIWGKSCIDVQIRPIIYITSATLKTSDDLTAIRAAYTDGDPNVIEAFFVQNALPSTGGGNAGGIGVASCKPVMAEPNGGNPVLTSHELGHVLGLLHPGGGSNSDAGTVMAPTGSAMNPGTEFVTHFMCTNISNPVLQTLAEQCCLTHDIGDHYIRDFPVDVGSEPSEPLPAGMTRYSMSNVWNRLTDTPGGFNPATGPAHQHPVRFNADMTPRTNYLYARVEQLQNLQVRNASVRYYLKNPGSGGGAANLTFLGAVSVPDAIAVGVPQTVRLPWTVPAGTPQHSCLFAVVRSDAEPEGNQSGLTWQQFEALSRNDNDWAQRNLNIQNTGSGNTLEDSNIAASAPFIIRIPPTDGYERLPLVLQVDASAAVGLELLALEIPGRERIELKPGEQVTVTPRSLIVPGEDYIIVLQAIIPGGIGPGRVYGVQVNPSVAKTDLVGFACEFRVSRPSVIIAQVMDTIISAFVDLATVTDLPFAHKLVRATRIILSEPPYSPSEMAKVLVGLSHLIEEGEGVLQEIKAAQRFGVIEALDQWRKIVAKFEAGSVSPLNVVESFRDLSQRLLMTASELFISLQSVPETVQIILDKLEILYDHDLLGPGEFYFLSQVKDGQGRLVKKRFPEVGYYIIDAGCRTATVQLDAPLYEGVPGSFLKIQLEGREVDCFGKEDKLCLYERDFTGDSSAFRGSYVPGDEIKDPESLCDWRIFYRIV